MDESPLRFGMRAWWRSITIEQRVAVGVLGVCGVVALSLSMSQLYDRVHSPFLVPNTILADSRKVLAEQEAAQKKLDELKNVDTDHDGLSDYDELYVYHTSPYLADTDSDGIPDGVEIAQATDPNCAKGKSCFDASTQIIQASSTEGFQELLQVNKVDQAPPTGLVGANASSVAGAEAFVNNPLPPSSMTATQIRAYLIANNLVTKEQLDILPDSVVLQVYQAAYQQALGVQTARQTGATTTSP